MHSYWNNRFSNGMVWGEKPSCTVNMAKEVFLNNQAKTILVPGAGYGRNTKVLSPTFEVDAIEISKNAIAIALEEDKLTKFTEGSIFDMPFSNKKYDGIYCYNLLQLFRLKERRLLIGKCIDQLTENGILFFTCFSNEDKSFGDGLEVEKNTFEYKPGKVAHFFSEEDLIHHFDTTEILETGSIDETLDYLDNTVRTYKLRYIICKKRLCI
ncbi:class I SAM-dependent methyltransferase [Bacillus spongiae]|uniref:Class I SAM-dependent methyltransferase n=1 Tax=Bacillus spongiae TaxID=2683610 RepID=A0ABU8HKG0_9BACI